MINGFIFFDLYFTLFFAANTVQRSSFLNTKSPSENASGLFFTLHNHMFIDRVTKLADNSN